MPSAAGPTRPSQAERVETSRQALLDAAAELVVEQGYHATSAADIAERAGYSREMVRVRFGSKLDLMRELLVTEYHEAFRDRLGADASALDQIYDGIEQLGAMSGAAPTRLRAAFVLSFESATDVPALRDDVAPWLASVEAHFAQLFEAAVTEGSIRKINCGEYAQLLIAAATGGAFHYITSTTADDPAAPMRTVLQSITR